LNLVQQVHNKLPFSVEAKVEKTSDMLFALPKYENKLVHLRVKNFAYL